MRTYRLTFTTADRTAEYIEYVNATSVADALKLLDYDRLGLILVDAYW